MTKSFVCFTAILILAAAAMPVSAGAQPPKQPAAAPAAHPAPHVAAPHVAAPHFAAPHFAPRIAAPRVAPHFAAPHRVVHAAPHVAPHFAAPRVAPQFTPRHAERHITPNTNTVRHAATPNLPAAQQHVQGREQFRNAHERHALQHQQTQPNVQSTIQAQPNAQAAVRTRRNLRRNGTASITPQAARQGRFASRFAAHRTRASADPVAARRAWHRHRRAAFVPWYGPVFWPYAYSDIFDYAFWPDGYDDGFWAYAYDDFFDGIFWGEQGPPQEYAEDYGYAEPAGPRPSYAGVQELCTEPGSGVTAWPFAQIEQKVGLNAQQKSLLDQVRSAASKAGAVFRTSCPAQNAFPLTPPGRIEAMVGRLQATLEAVDTVRPALDAFYNSLSDEQKERFNELGPKTAAATTAQASEEQASACKQPKPGLANLPIEKIEDVVQPTQAQEAGLDRLQDATNKGVSIMQAACPDETPLTPPGRLDAMQSRLKAMIAAANTVKPALDGFYASLSNEQKARFDRIGQELAQSGG